MFAPEGQDDQFRLVKDHTAESATIMCLREDDSLRIKANLLYAKRVSYIVLCIPFPARKYYQSITRGLKLKLELASNKALDLLFAP